MVDGGIRRGSGAFAAKECVRRDSGESTKLCFDWSDKLDLR
jgi:hypothetical protein